MTQTLQIVKAKMIKVVDVDGIEVTIGESESKPENLYAYTEKSPYFHLTGRKDAEQTLMDRVEQTVANYRQMIKDDAVKAAKKAALRK